MPSQPVTDTVTLGDDYQSLANLLGLEGQGWRLIEGTLQARSNALQLRLGDQTTPPTSTEGQTVLPGAALGMGPTSPEAGWPLAQLWARNDVAGSNATLALLGVIASPS